MGELDTWYGFDDGIAYPRWYCGTAIAVPTGCMVLCIQVYLHIDIAYYTKMSARWVHMILYEKYLQKHMNFGGMDKYGFPIDFSAIKC